MERKDNKYKFKMNVLKESDYIENPDIKDKTILKILTNEWVYLMHKDNLINNNECICEKKGLRYINIFFHKETGRLIKIGDECLKKFNYKKKQISTHNINNYINKVTNKNNIYHLVGSLKYNFIHDSIIKDYFYKASKDNRLKLHEVNEYLRKIRLIIKTLKHNNLKYNLVENLKKYKIKLKILKLKREHYRQEKEQEKKINEDLEIYIDLEVCNNL